MRRPKVRELGEAIRSLFGKPYTVRYPYEPVIAPEAFRGRPKFVEEECIGCGACARVCPARAIDICDVVEDGNGVRTMTVHHGRCVFCGQCHRYCTTQEGIVLTNEYETGTYDLGLAISNVEKELLICQECGEIIATVDHVRWVAQKLGAKAFGNMGLALLLSKDLGLIPPVTRDPERPLDRGDNVSLLCPRCKREVILYEQWGP